MKLYLDSNVVEGTPEEILKYKEIIKDEADTNSTDIKVGDRVKVLESESGAEGEATVTAVLENGDVNLAGTNNTGKYSDSWWNNIENLEKIEEDTTLKINLFDISN